MAHSLALWLLTGVGREGEGAEVPFFGVLMLWREEEDGCFASLDIR